MSDWRGFANTSGNWGTARLETTDSRAKPPRCVLHVRPGSELLRVVSIDREWSGVTEARRQRGRGKQTDLAPDNRRAVTRAQGKEIGQARHARAGQRDRPGPSRARRAKR